MLRQHVLLPGALRATLRALSPEEFHAAALPYIAPAVPEGMDTALIASLLHQRCEKLTDINLGKVLVLREGAFYGCSSLTDVDYSGAVVIAEWVFSKTGVIFP